MNFQRARTDKNKEKRWDEIIDSTTELFEEFPFAKISLSNISKNTSFTRANLYSYVSSKDEIFLKILLKDFGSWVKHLEKKTKSKSDISSEEFIRIWCDSINEHKRLFHLFVLLKFVIEENVGLEPLIEFKTELTSHFKPLQSIISKCLPALSDKAVYDFFNAQYYFAVGVLTVSEPNKTQRNAHELSESDYIIPDFYDELKNHLRIYLSGLSAK